LTGRGRAQEGAYRMLCNKLAPEVAERPQDLVVYGGTGKAARDWPSFHRIVAALKRLKDDETLLVQSGKPVGIFRTHEYAPRVLIANSLLVPHWATWEHFWELERLGLMMYGQMTAGSWIYIGTQGILQGTYETFNAVAAKRFGGSLKGRVVLTSGLGGMGGAQPLAVTMNGGVALCIEVDPARIERRVKNRYLDRGSRNLEEAVSWGAEVFDYGNNLRGQALAAGVMDAFEIPGFVVAYIRPLFCEGKGPFRWVALSGEAADIYKTDQAVLDEFPDNEPLRRWLTLARDRVQFQGLPARICWLGYGERERAGRRFNRMVKSGELKAPIVIGRDHLDAGSVASPYRETEGMRDGSDAVADWPSLNALVKTAAGASWVSVHHGGGVGMGNSIHAGMVVVADGTDAMDERLQRVLTTDPGMGVIRHADAGYETAVEFARAHHLDRAECSRPISSSDARRP